MKNLFKKIIAYVFAGFILMMFLTQNTLAKTPLEDITLTLSIETQDLAYDFDDEGESVKKERIVIYRLEVMNQGSATHNNLRLFMDSPDYMDYQAGTSTLQTGLFGNPMPLSDEEGHSPLALGYFLSSLPAGERYTFQAEYQVTVPESVTDERLYTVAWASLVGPYSAIPVMSNPVNTIISGKPEGELSVKVTPFPSADTTVFSGSFIVYTYKLTNSGGLPVQDVTLVTYVPEGAVCIENCGTIQMTEDLQAGESVTIDMKVQVTTTNPDKEFITNIGFDASTRTMEYTEVRDEINHPLNGEIQVGSGQFTLFTEQVPNLILNSANGQPRPDQGDITETQYAIQYMGRGKPNTFDPGIGGFGVQERGPNYYDHACGRHNYDHGILSSVYAYNSSGGGCQKMNGLCISSSPILFNITTTLPSEGPSLIFNNGSHFKSAIYAYGNTSLVNRFMQSSGVIKVPANFTLSRAIEDGAVGSVLSSAEAAGIREDLWTYEIVGDESESCNCGDDGCTTATYPIYAWKLLPFNSVILPTLSDDDTTHISVYSSTAWLKTEGGHIGTNGAIINNETAANHVRLEFGGGSYMTRNEYVYDPNTILTPTNTYTKFGETNGDYMIFANQGNEAFVSAAGESWLVRGTNFGDQQRGDSYDRANNPRDYTDDLLVREKFGKVNTDELPTLLRGTINIGDDVIWRQTGNLTIGTEGLADTVTFAGGQSRIYVEGDVFINADIYYGSSGGSGYNEATSLRIDARNIYISGEVTDLEILLQARENFHSGESYDQLRILGDVITGNAHWERKPVLELNPDEINKPSEYIIEDLRKYVIPVPGDTELPDEYDIWRQVNPGTGQVLDAY